MSKRPSTTVFAEPLAIVESPLSEDNGPKTQI